MVVKYIVVFNINTSDISNNIHLILTFLKKVLNYKSDTDELRFLL